MRHSLSKFVAFLVALHAMGACQTDEESPDIADLAPSSGGKRVVLQPRDSSPAFQPVSGGSGGNDAGGADGASSGGVVVASLGGTSGNSSSGVGGLGDAGGSAGAHHAAGTVSAGQPGVGGHAGVGSGSVPEPTMSGGQTATCSIAPALCYRDGQVQSGGAPSSDESDPSAGADSGFEGMGPRLHLGGTNDPSPIEISAINSLGQMVGSRNNLPIIYENGAVRCLSETEALSPVDINDAGVVVGHTWDGSEVMGFIWQDGETTLVELPDGARVQAINNSGQILAVNDNQAAFLFSNGAWIELRSAEGCPARVTDMNNLGQLVGSVSTNATCIGSDVGFIWTNGEFVLFPEMRGVTAINDSGQFIANVDDFHHVLWDGERLHDLVEEWDWHFVELTGIAPDGAVIGVYNGTYGFFYDGKSEPVPLTARVENGASLSTHPRQINARHEILGYGGYEVCTGPWKYEQCVDFTYDLVWGPGCVQGCCPDPN